MKARSPWIFFLLVFALAAPFLVIGGLAGQGLLKGLRVLLLFPLAAFCEEAGSMGYAIEPQQARWGALGGALILGAVWALIHVIPDLQGHHPWAWIVGQRLFTVALRVLIVWAYNNTGETVLVAVLFHTLDNVSVFSLFPDNGGGHYVPAVTAALTALTAVIVTILWGPRTLARFRFA